MKRQINFTIIIPHHNEVSYLRRLVASIPKREDVQVVIVDDHSDEDSRRQLEFLMVENQTIEIYFLPENLGGGGARNFGLTKAQGEYVLFADSDDFFLPSLENILNSVNKDYDIVFFNALSLDEFNYHIKSRNKRLNYWINNYLQNGDERALRYLFGEPWCKIIKRKVITENDVYFEETKIHNDTYFSYKIGYFAKSIQVIDICGYVITERAVSVSKKVSDDRMVLRAKVFFQKNKFLKQNKLHIIDRLFLSSYWEYLKHFKIKKLLSLNKNAGISWYNFLQMSINIIFQEFRNKCRLK